jgi:hypothetical protein
MEEKQVSMGILVHWFIYYFMGEGIYAADTSPTSLILHHL